MDVSVSYSNKPQYRFPILKDKDIIECLTDAGIEVYSNELMEPNRHKDKVKAIFLELVLIGLNLPKDTFTTTSMSLMKKRQNLPHPELHDESLSNFKFIKALMKLMSISGITDFTLRDLYAPSTKRFKRQLSGIINYIKFTIEKQSTLFNEINEQKEDLIGQLLEVQQEQEMLKEQLSSTQVETNKKWEERKVVDDDCGEIEVEIARQNKLQTSIRQESENLKKQANVLKDKIDTAELIIQELGVKERKFASQVVESPDVLKQEIEIQQDTLDKERALCHEAEGNAKKGNLRIQYVTKAQESVVEATTLIKQVIEIKAKHDQSLEESKSVEERVHLNEMELAKSKQLCEDLEYQLRQLEETSANFKIQAKTKMDGARASLHAINAELLIVEKDRRDATAKVDQCEHEVQLLKRVIDEEKLKTDQEIADIVSRFQQMEPVLMAKINKFDSFLKENLENTV